MTSETLTERPAPAPWGYLLTFAWVVLAFIVSLGITAAVLSALNLSPSAPLQAQFDGAAIAVTIFVSTPVQIAVLALAAQRAGWPPAAYLGLDRPSRRAVTVGAAAVVILILVFDGLFVLFGQDIVSEFQVDIYRAGRDGGWLVAMMIAVIVFAPVGEEIVFRGFMFRGWARTREAAPYAIVAIALLWSLLHIQYNWLGLVQVFASGLLLGWVRWVSGSTTLTIALHAVINAIAMIETAVKVEGGG
jgi:hypothetical protein